MLGSKNIKSNHKLSANSKHFFTKKIKKRHFKLAVLGYIPKTSCFLSMIYSFFCFCCFNYVVIRLTPLQNNKQKLVVHIRYDTACITEKKKKLGEPCVENKGIDQPAHQKNATKN